MAPAEADAPTESVKNLDERGDRVAANDDVKTNVGCDKSSMISNLQAQASSTTIKEAANATQETNAPAETSGLAEIDTSESSVTVSTEQPVAQTSETSVPQANPPLSQQIDDGWEPKWDDQYQTWYFFNRFTGAMQWENPRVPETQQRESSIAVQQQVPQRPTFEQTGWAQVSQFEYPQPAAGYYAASAYFWQPESSSSNAGPSSSPKHTGPAGRYNPAIHGSWDPNADYAREVLAAEEEQETQSDPPTSAPNPYAGSANPYNAQPTHAATFFNKVTGQFQASNENRHSNVAKDKRQMEAFFNVDVAANSHEGKSLKAERRNQKVSKKQIKAWNERAQKKKWEKKTAWLKD